MSDRKQIIPPKKQFDSKKEGIQAGIEKGKRESAIKMLKNGFQVKMISEILGLTVQEIEKLK